MKINNDSHYNSINSFDDLHREKEILILKSKLIEARIDMEISVIRKVFSVTNMVLSLAKEFIMPKITAFIEDFFNSKKDSPE